jgi:hypothetical protein
MLQAGLGDMQDKAEDSAASDLRDKGYAVFRGVLEPAEVEELRARVTAHLRRSGRARYGGRYELRALNRIPELARMLCGEGPMAVVRCCVGPEGAVLTGECDIMADTTSSWHSDVPPALARGDALRDDGSFRVCKLAIYLQDQPARSPEVLKVRPGSHRRAGHGAMPVEALDVRRGDVIAFDIRIDHAGRMPTLVERLAHRLLAGLGAVLRIDPEPAYTALRRGVRLLTGRGRQRVGVFLTFGPEGPATRAYEAAGRHEHGPLPAPLDPAAAAALLRQGVGIIQAA